MNKSQRIIASMLLLVSGIVAIGYGWTGIDFAIADDLWSPNGDRTTIFPLFGTIDVVLAFQISFVTVMIGFVMALVGGRIAIATSSATKNIFKVVTGAWLVAWAIWGFAFAYRTAEWRQIVDIDAVDIPCPEIGGDPICRFTSTEWFLLNAAMGLIGLVLAVMGARSTRVVRIMR